MRDLGENNSQDEVDFGDGRRAVPGPGVVGQSAAMPGDDESGESIGRLVGTGVRWSLLGTSLARIVGLASTIVMARLLSPEDFGIYTAGAVVLVVAAYFNDLGLEPILVRWPGGLAKVAPTAMTLVGLVSTALFVVVFAVAPWLAAALGSPGGAGVVRVMAVGLLISAVFTVNSAQVNRLFRQKARTKAELCSLVVNITLGIGLASMGFGAYSLAIAQICGNFVASIGLFLASPVHYRPGFDRTVAKELIGIGVPLSLSGLFVGAALNLDFVVVGHVLGASALGLYVLAWNVANWPVTAFVSAIQNVSVAGFARVRHDHRRLEAAFLGSLRAAFMVIAPVCALLAGLASPLVALLYGSKWAGAAEALAVLAGLGCITVATTLASDLLIAAGFMRATFLLRGVWLCALLIALPIGANVGGITGVAMGQLLVGALVMLPVVALILRSKGFAVAELVRASVLPLAAGLAAFAVALGVSALPLGNLAQLITGGLLAGAVYLSMTAGYWLPIVRRSVANRRESNRRGAHHEAQT